MTATATDPDAIPTPRAPTESVLPELRATWWETRDFCDRSGVRVKEGSVLATNLVTKQKKVVPKGKIYSVPKP